MTIIDGRATAAQIKAELAAKVLQVTESGARPPHLSAVLVGHDGGSEAYVASKERACAECGYTSSIIRFDDTVTQQQLIDEIHRLNDDPTVDGFIVQLPLPRHIDTQAVIEAIDPAKDVDGFHPVNVGRLSIGIDAFAPATPAGIVELLHRNGISTQGRHCVIIGRSNIVGKPLASLLMHKSPKGNATVTVCHSATPNLAAITRQADILIAATGQPASVTADMVKDGAVVVDVGTTRVADPSRPSGYRLQGDVDFQTVAPKCSRITPVPGGVGPMTIATLMQNTLKAYQMHNA